MRTLFAVLLLSAALSGQGKPDISLKVSPQVAFLGVPVKVSVTIKPHPELRVARVQMFPFADSSWQLDPRLNGGTERRSFTFKLPEPGEYPIVLVVYDAQGKELARKEVQVKRIAPEEP
jgi:hypothetical protein